MSKEGLQQVIQQEQVDSEKGNLLSTEDLRDLFTFNGSISSEIHEKMCCNRCKQGEMILDSRVESDYTNVGCQPDDEDIGGFAGIAGCLNNLKSYEKQVGTPKEEDLASWGHHHFPSSVPDCIFQASAGNEVSFVFTNQVDGKLVPVESTRRTETEEVDQPKTKTNFRSALSKPSLLSYKNQATLLSNSPSKDSIGSSFNLKPLQKPRSKLMRTSEGKTHSKLSPSISPGNQIPSNRIPPSCIYDDDFA
ncbi:hypothetical protein ACJIZ3_015489 [Penstemon smallii]|uniref:Uncharacterized protein n=1 Tax=Penstemon smallii TaxID=265156 RepID=A0ABD3RQM9_9LAMI